MKRIYFIRHGKSSWLDNIEDFDRPLAQKGEEASKLVGEYLNSNYSDRNIVALSSAANRAKSTLQIVSKYYNFYTTEILEDLYTFNNMTLLYQITNFDNNLDEIALFGHNPAFHMLVTQFTFKIIDKFPTCTLAVVQFEEDDWQLCKLGELIDFKIPKEL